MTSMGYFADLMSANEEVQDSIRPLLKLSREHIVRAQRLDYALVSSLERDPLRSERLTRLRTGSRSGADHVADLGSGNQRLHPFSVGQAGHQLLLPLWRREEYS